MKTQVAPDRAAAESLMKTLDRQKFMGLNYVSEEEVRRHAEDSFKRAHAKRLDTLDHEERALIEELSRHRVLTKEAREAWVQKLLSIARKRGRLMTPQQYDDYLLGVRLQPGMNCRYIGPTREETSENGQTVVRTHGQRGVIVQSIEDRIGRILVFHPHDAVKPTIPEDAEAVFVDLQVREYTTGWLQLEREAPG